MTGRLGGIIDKLMSAGAQQRAASTAIGAALGALIGPVASSLTGDSKSEENTTARDMVAGALGGALGGMVNPMVGAAGGAAGGLMSGLFDKEKKAGFGGATEQLQGFAMTPEALSVLGGLGVGLGAGRAVAGHTAAELAPRGRKMRSEDIARRAAFIAAPAAGIGALILARRKGLTPLLQLRHMNKFPKGLMVDPHTEQELLQYLVPAGVGAAGGVAGGLATGGIVGGIQRLRGSPFGTQKEASVPGQDLRSPVMGGMKFPTQDSVSAASKKLQQSSAEVGPQPAPLYSAMGQTKKAMIGDPMDPMMDDPLVLFLKKAAVEEEAKEQPPLTGLVEGSELENNLSGMQLGKEEFERTSLPPVPTKRMIPTTPDKGVEDYFTNARTMRKKLYEKDHPFEGFDQGVVDRILGL